MLTLKDYRNSESAAQQVAQNLLPDINNRTACLSLLAESILQAHKNGSSPAVWSVTLSKNGFIRLNIGVIEVLALFPDLVHIVLNGHILTDTERTSLEALGAVSGGWLDSYERVSGSEMWNIPVEKLSVTHPIFLKSYTYLIEQAADSVKWRTGYFIHHSPGVLKYIRSSLKKHIPDPSYERDHPANRKRYS